MCLSQNMYRSDLNYLRGAAWIATGALQIEGSKRATDLISDVGHHQKSNLDNHSMINSFFLTGQDIEKTWTDTNFVVPPVTEKVPTAAVQLQAHLRH